MMRLSSCFTLIMGTYRIYSILGWIWCLQWTNIQLYYVARGFRLIKHIPEPRMSQLFGRN
ncbi:hypothetical protein Godav_028916 [Gossypium davidsonii]|uniref:Uncharacterized protein n=1 Tax=Gossypium davidsonii TaxID=34287 RepID=A0A7J8TFU0_GOSDV|nr:hypothetical protein [Gossypium davidsonii]